MSEEVLAGLRSEFRAQVETLIAMARERDIALVPTSGARDPWRQARLWRRSRNAAQVQSKIEELREGGAPYLAEILASVGPQPNGSWRTDAPPGLSWHQLGEAVDFAIRSPASGRVLYGDVDQDGDEYDYGQECYDRLGQMCTEQSLRWGGGFGDQNHVQRPAGRFTTPGPQPERDQRDDRGAVAGRTLSGGRCRHGAQAAAPLRPW